MKSLNAVNAVNVLSRRQFAARLARHVSLPAATLALMQARPAQARDTALPVPRSLPEAAQAAARQGQALVLLVTLPGCPFCEQVRRHYLLPARQESGLPAWQLSISDRQTPLTGFDGQPTTAAAQIQAWKAGFTPTVLFLGPQGQELAERLVGMSADFYQAYLDDRLSTARQALRQPG